jgi:hypothetical protein
MTRPYRPATLASDLATWTHHELRDEIERLRAYLLAIAQGTNEEWTHDWALRAIETSDPFVQPSGGTDTYV